MVCIASTIERPSRPGLAPPPACACRASNSAPPRLRAGKGSAYKGGLRFPGLARWPGVIALGQGDATPINLMDWAATFLALAGATSPPDHPLDGLDLTPRCSADPN